MLKKICAMPVVYMLYQCHKLALYELLDNKNKDQLREIEQLLGNYNLRHYYSLSIDKYIEKYYLKIVGTISAMLLVIIILKEWREQNMFDYGRY